MTAGMYIRVETYQPKCSEICLKITREEIVNAAVDLVRKAGEQAINARMVAAMLNCSTQPIFSNFATREELRLAVGAAANDLCNE